MSDVTAPLPAPPHATVLTARAESPLVTAGLSLGTGVAAIGLLSHVIQMASFTDELALLIGFGVGVDYALFIVTRYRQGLLRGLSGEEAVV